MLDFFKTDKKNKKDDLEESEKSWMDEENEEGQLSIDVYETNKKIIIVSTIAGVKPEDLDISLHNDMLTIRGERKRSEEVKEDDYLYQECFWGYFSRSIILPTEVDTKKIDAVMENGVLTINLEKVSEENNISVKIK
ncbi:Hsp20/alpha crystallin family protein [bacterium]|nr:Hsp20/alpha crystallin family protein [bacterium]